MKKKHLAGFLCATLTCFSIGCSSFEREWKQSVAQYQSGTVKSPEGPWVGTWTTTTNGHSGDLRAIVKPSAKVPNDYEFRYHATWEKILSGTYSVRFPATTQRGVTRVDGSKNMGLFGTFSHKATITKDRFEATYSNKKADVGVFSMKRP